MKNYYFTTNSTIIAKITLLLFSLFSHQLHAQENEIVFDIQLYSTKNGLVQNDITSIYQDSKGLMWFGTNAGISRFDGYSFTNYSMDTHQLTSNIISCFQEDQFNNLWIGLLNSGICRLNLETGEMTSFRNVQDSKILSSNNVHSLALDDEGNLWVGTTKGLNRIPADELTKDQLKVQKYYANHHNSKSILSNGVVKLFNDRNGNLWVGTKKGLQIAIKPSNNQPSYTFKEISNTKIPPVKDITESEDGVFFSGPHGIQLFNEEKSSLRKVSTSRFNTLCIDPNKYMIGGTRKGLLFMEYDEVSGTYIQKKHIHSENFDALKINIITEVYKDKLGVIWIGTKGGGVIKYNPNGKRFKDIYKTNDPSSISYNKIRSIYEDSKGRIWVGTQGGALNVLENSSKGMNVGYKSFTIENLKPNTTFDITEWGDQLMFGIRKKGKVYQMDIDTNLETLTDIDAKFLLTENEDAPSFTIQSDGDDVIWLGTYGKGLIRGIKNNGKIEWTNISNQKDLQQGKVKLIRNILIDSYGNLWVGSSDGLVFISKEEKLKDRPAFEIYQHHEDQKNSLSYNYLLPVFEASNGEIWIGTMGGGLNIVNPEKVNGDGISFEHIKIDDGLPSNIIKSILEDDYQNLWIASNNGITRINLDSREIKNYNISDGLQDNEFSDLAACKLKNGDLMFGGVNGINYFTPHEIVDDYLVGDLVFTELSVLNKNIHVNDTLDGNVILKKNIQYTQKIQLNHDQNSFAVQFAGLHYGSPFKNKYKYKLNGFDENWITTNADFRIAKYTNLSPGNYTLEVKASNGDNIWNPKSLYLDIEIAAPWWATLWAKVLYVIAIVGFIYLFSRFSLITVKKRHQLELEQFEREKLEHLSQMKLQFFTNISHELRTPLTLIHTPIEQLMSKGNAYSSLEKEKYYKLIHKNVNHLMNLVNQLLDFRKMEQGHTALQVKQGDWVLFTEQIYHSFKEFANHERVDFSLDIKTHSIKGLFDQDKLKKILNNLLSNAFKFTYAGQVKMTIQQENNHVVIEVKDTGFGISEEHLKYLFEPFYQVDNQTKSKSEGTGIGLSFTKSLVELHHGTIEVESKQNAGSTFKIQFPLDEVAYQDDVKIESISEEAVVIENEEEEELTAQEEELSLTTKPKIVIADDNPAILDLLYDLLKDTFKVYKAEDGEKAFQLAKEVMPNLILSDIMMPIMDGYELTRKIREDVQVCHLPIILLTAKNSNDSKLKGYEYGVDAYVTKPFNTEVLMARINTLVENRKRLQKNFRTNIDTQPSEVTFTSIDERFLNRLIDIVEENISDPKFTVEKLAHEYGTNPLRLNQKLKALTEQTAKIFIRNIRLKRAAQLLKMGRYCVSDVTYEVGFSDLKYFRNCFKKEFGVPPSHFLRNKKKKEEEIEDAEMQ
ncbi:hybrid sensor histidine kinase/response regulator transcription factor [Flammeovirga agarivorans]|uniref:histidine kinase n=1 Tax=Flammeovirga agarivorans TaxID=2726742 RepID=A0A7X8SKJ1_9BACT|nr:hybrid sensor histidine kinase/response regulator transcription factor [Flammeovirga agarivorans]NLR91837.1 response regulator [Flammeovirga agarivorans]